MSCSQDLNDARNGAILTELKFKPNENLAIYRKRLDLIGCEPIVQETTETGAPGGLELTFRAKQVVQSIFDQYCEPDRLPMTQASAISLINRWNGNATFKEDARVSVFLKQYGEPDTGAISHQSLVRFILDMAWRGEDLQLRMGLKEMGYSKNLTRLPQDGDDDNVMQVRPGVAQMPRYMIANNEQYFDVLMSLLDLTKEVSTRALEMIEMLVTSPILYDRVIRLDAEDQGESFSWSRIFDGSNVHKMLYCLEIVEAILVRDQEKRSTHDWVSRFLELQGFE
jgi:hypothetical protein